MTQTIDDLLASSMVDDPNQKDVKIEELPDNKKQESAFINTVAPIDKKEKTQNIAPVLSYTQPKISNDKQNTINIENKTSKFENKVVDLGGVFDSIVEKKKQLAYANPAGKKTKAKNKNLLYTIVIIVILSIIVFLITSASIAKKSKDIERERVKQEIQLRMQQNLNTR